MLTIFACLVIVAVLLGLKLLIDKYGWFSAEFRRKFFHISAGSFAAFWPWLMSMNAIKILGLGMLAGVGLNQYLKVFSFTKGLKRKTYGVAFSALALSAAASLTNNKVIFCLAILCLAIADALAALVGTHYGKPNQYKVLGQTKSLVGTMTFWLACLFILGIGLPFVPAHHYLLLLIALPPVLALVENISIAGLDNLTVPVVLILILRAVG